MLKNSAFSLILRTQFYAIAEKCYCENQNGGTGKNGLICEKDGSFLRTDSCQGDEWCTGPGDENSATHSRNDLCTKGNISRIFEFISAITVILTLAK